MTTLDQPTRPTADEPYAQVPDAYAPDTAGPYPLVPIQVTEPGRFQSFVSRAVTGMPAWVAPAGVALCIGGGVAYTLLMDPTQTSAGAQPTCIMRLFTGFDCPGCGGTRAAWYLLHGDIPAAARHHAPLVFAAPFLAYMYLVWAAKSVVKRFPLPQLRLSNAVMIGFLGGWALFSVLRNLPWDPFTWFWV